MSIARWTYTLIRLACWQELNSSGKYASCIQEAVLRGALDWYVTRCTWLGSTKDRSPCTCIHVDYIHGKAYVRGKLMYRKAYVRGKLMYGESLHCTCMYTRTHYRTRLFNTCVPSCSFSFTPGFHCIVMWTMERTVTVVRRQKVQKEVIVIGEELDVVWFADIKYRARVAAIGTLLHVHVIHTCN